VEESIVEKKISEKKDQSPLGKKQQGMETVIALMPPTDKKKAKEKGKEFKRKQLRLNKPMRKNLK